MIPARGSRWIPLALALALGATGCRAGGKPPADPAPPDEVEVGSLQPVRLQEFVLGPGDELKIDVWRHPELSGTARVSSAGSVQILPVGEIEAAGLGLQDFQDRVQAGLARFYKDPIIAVEVVNSRRSKVYVLGEVARPGVYPIEDSLHVVEALAQAGGFTPAGQQTQVIIVRGGLETPELLEFNFKSVVRLGDVSGNIYLQAGDVVYVPATPIAKVDRFFVHLKTILSPLLDAERIRVLRDNPVGAARLAF